MSSRELSYSSYILLPELLAGLRPLSSSEDNATYAAERFFIVCHQASELLASQILADLKSAAALAAESADWPAINEFLLRCSSLTLLLSRHIEQLASLCPRDAFMRFRPVLQGLSAGESPQLQELLTLADGTNAHLRVIRDRVAERANCPAGSRGVDCGHDECVAVEALEILVSGCALWRTMHIGVVIHFIGEQPGTGGTSGVDYLMRRNRPGAPPHVAATPGHVSPALPDITVEQLLPVLQALEGRVAMLIKAIRFVSKSRTSLGFSA
jgi:tryptophan 2,3-dioxygenase